MVRSGGWTESSFGTEVNGDPTNLTYPSSVLFYLFTDPVTGQEDKLTVFPNRSSEQPPLQALAHF